MSTTSKQLSLFAFILMCGAASSTQAQVSVSDWVSPDYQIDIQEYSGYLLSGLEDTDPGVAYVGRLRGDIPPDMVQEIELTCYEDFDTTAPGIQVGSGLVVRVASVTCPSNFPILGEMRMRLLTFNDPVHFIYRRL